jgi:hypothetical protein
MPNLVPSAARTTSGSLEPSDGIATEYGRRNALRVQLDVTAASGTTPSLVVTVQDTLDNTNWNNVGTFATKTGVGREVINIAGPFADRIRIAWTITGTTPSFTFSVDSHAE